MATETKDSTKDQAAAASPAQDGLFDLDKLDALIGEQDPDFHSGIKEIAPEAGDDQFSIDLIDLDKLLEEEEARSLKARFKRTMARWRSFQTALRKRLFHFFRYDVPQLGLKGLKASRSLVDVAQEAMRQFAFKPLRYKLMFFGVLVVIGIFCGYVYVAVTKGIVPQDNDLFILSMEQIADHTDTYEPATESEVLYDSPRAAQNVIIIPRMVANVRKSPKSGPNPMVACEFYIEGNSPDVVVEIKDREYEFRDLFQRAMEEMTAEQLETVDGKKLLLEKLSREANRIVTKGRVRNIFFKNIIVKP